MRSKAPLALMEQLVMVLVFALAAALCVQVFVLSGQTSRWNESRDRALVEAQNAAEILKGLSGDYEAACAACGGQWNGTMWGISYDEQWKPAENASQAAYHLLVTPVDSETALLGGASIAVYAADCQAETILAQLRSGTVPEGVSVRGDVYSYTCPISDTQTLQVEVRVDESAYTILRWQAVSTADWQAEEDLEVWDGAS